MSRFIPDKGETVIRIIVGVLVLLALIALAGALGLIDLRQ